MTPEHFSSLIDQCAEGSAAADREITADVIARISASSWDYGIDPQQLLKDAMGGPDRAQLHFWWARESLPNPVAYGNGGRCQVGSGQGGGGGGSLFGWVPLPRRRIKIYGGAQPAGAWVLHPIHEYVASPDFTIAAGSWLIEVTGAASSRSTAPSTSVQLRIALNGSVLATHSQIRASAEVDDLVTFNTSNTTTLGALAVLTLVNPTAFEQNFTGFIRITPQ